MFKFSIKILLSLILAFVLMSGPFLPYTGYLTIYGYGSLLIINLLATLSLAFVFYQLLDLLDTKRLKRSRLVLIYSLYSLILTYSLFFKSIGVQGLDLDPLSFVSDFLYGQGFLLLANLFLFLPLGLLFPLKIKHLLIFLLVITGIEASQYLFHLGIFDLGDIVLNTIGFSLGMLLHQAPFIQKIKTGL